jgi:predicted RecB family nuclease
MQFGKPYPQDSPRAKISVSIFEAALRCMTKCFLRSRGEAGIANGYAGWVMRQIESYRKDGVERLAAGVGRDDCVIGWSGMENPKASKWQLAINLVANWQNLETSLHALERVQSKGRGKAKQLIPIRFVFSNKITRDDKVLMAFDAFVLSEMLGREVSLGRLIHGDRHVKLNVRTLPLVKKVRKLIMTIEAMLSSDSPPDLVLNRHCDECEFQTLCRQRAIEKNDLSLLGGMTERNRKKFNSKGIFTITQLSYTFRPRRRGKRKPDRREKYHHALKALSIREHKIHIVGRPEPWREGKQVFIDVEGLPDRDT